MSLRFFADSQPRTAQGPLRMRNDTESQANYFACSRFGLIESTARHR